MLKRTLAAILASALTLTLAINVGALEFNPIDTTSTAHFGGVSANIPDSRSGLWGEWGGYAGFMMEGEAVHVNVWLYGVSHFTGEVALRLSGAPNITTPNGESYHILSLTAGEPPNPAELTFGFIMPSLPVRLDLVLEPLEDEEPPGGEPPPDWGDEDSDGDSGGQEPQPP